MNEDRIRTLIKEETADIRQETRYNSVMLEDQAGILQGMTEGIAALQGVPQLLAQIIDRLEKLEADNPLLKEIVKDHEDRLRTLETGAQAA